jgi:hypothetical protein
MLLALVGDLIMQSWVQGLVCATITIAVAGLAPASAQERRESRAPDVDPYGKLPIIDYRALEKEFPAPELAEVKEGTTIDEGPFVFFDSTPAVLVGDKESIAQFEATLDWIDPEIVPRAVVTTLEIRDLPKGEPRVITQEWLEGLRPGFKFIIEIERQDPCSPATLVSWGVAVDGQELKSGSQGLTKFWPADPRCFEGQLPSLGPNPYRFVIDSAGDDGDDGPGDGRCRATNSRMCSLRAAVEETNALPGPQTVGFKSGINPVMAAGAPALDVRGALYLVGNGQNVTTISAVGVNTVFRTMAADPNTPGSEAGELVLHGLSIIASATSYGANGRVLANNSVAELNEVTAFLHYSPNVPSSPFPTSDLIESDGRLVVRGSRLRREQGWYNDDALLEHLGGLALIEGSSIFGSSGDLFHIGRSGNLAIVNSTIAGSTNYKYLIHRAGPGSTSIFKTSHVPAGAPPLRLSLSNSTIADMPYLEGAWGVFSPRLRGQVRIGHTIISNIAGGCGGAPEPKAIAAYSEPPIWVLSSGYNLIDDLAGCELLDVLRRPAPGDQYGSAGQPLQAGLGPVVVVAGEEVFPLTKASPARDAGNPFPPGKGDPAVCTWLDQRLMPRPQSGRCDIGATEQ